MGNRRDHRCSRDFCTSAGNLIGSDIFNLVGVLGLAGMLVPLHIDEAVYANRLEANKSRRCLPRSFGCYALGDGF